MQLVKMNKRTQIGMLADFSFFIFLFTEFAFKHTIIGQIGLIFFMFSVLLLSFEKRKVYFSYYFFFLLVFVIYNYVNVKIGNSISPVTSLEMIKTLIVNLIAGFFIFNYMVIRNNLEKVMNIFIKVSLVFTLLMIIISIPELFRQRLGGHFSFLGIPISINANTVALISSFAFMFVFFNYLNNKKKCDFFKLLWFMIIVFISGSRKGFLIILLGPTILMYWMFPRKRIRNILIIVGMMVIFYAMIMYIPLFYNIIGIRVEELINYAMGQSYGDGSIISRLSYIELGWGYFLRRPWTGYGLDSFRHLPKAYNTYSHNNFIELLVSGGIPALTIYYSIHLVALTNIFNKWKISIPIVKLVIILLLILMFFDYAMVSYYDRLTLTMLMFVLSTLKISKKVKLQNN